MILLSRADIMSIWYAPQTWHVSDLECKNLRSYMGGKQEREKHSWFCYLDSPIALLCFLHAMCSLTQII